MQYWVLLQTKQLKKNNFPRTYIASSCCNPSSNLTKKMTEIRQTERVTTDKVSMQTVTLDLTNIFVGSSYSFSSSVRAISESGTGRTSMFNIEWYFSLSRTLSQLGCSSIVSGISVECCVRLRVLSERGSFYSVPRYRLRLSRPIGLMFVIYYNCHSVYSLDRRILFSYILNRKVQD